MMSAVISPLAPVKTTTGKQTKQKKKSTLTKSASSGTLLRPLQTLSGVGASLVCARPRDEFVSMEPPNDLASLEARFATEIPPANLLAIESGAFVPTRYPQSTPRGKLHSPSRRQRKRQLEEEAREQYLPMIQHLAGAAPNEDQLLHLPETKKKEKNIRNINSAVAIYSVDDPSVDALSTFNQSIEATCHREAEFTRAFRAAGKESRPREWIEREAARPSHLLAKKPLESKADQHPFLLKKTWPLLSSSASTPLLLMPPPELVVTEEKENVDSSIFDLTSIDAQAEEIANQPDEAITADRDPLSPPELTPHLSDSSSFAIDATNRPDGMLVDDLVAVDATPPAAESPTPPITHVVPTAETVSSTSALVHSPHHSISSSQELVPFEPPPVVDQLPTPTKFVSVHGGITLRSLQLDGLTAGSVDTGLPSIGTGFVVPYDPRPIKVHDFPFGSPSSEKLRALAKEFGYEPTPTHTTGALLNTHRIQFQSHLLSYQQHQSQLMSSPIAAKSTKESCIKATRKVQRVVLSQTSRERHILGLEAKLQEQEEKENNAVVTTNRRRPFTALGVRTPSTTNATLNEDEICDVDDLWNPDSLMSSAPMSPLPLSPTAAAPLAAQSPPLVQSSPVHSNLTRDNSASNSHTLRPSSSTSHLTNNSSTGRFSPTRSTIAPKNAPQPEFSLLGISQSVRSLPSVPSDHDLLCRTHSTGSLLLSNPIDRPRTSHSASVSRHGHPHRHGPSFMASNSSNDQSAMNWLQERLAASHSQTQLRQQRQQQEEKETPPQDSQSLVRPVTAPLGVFQPSSHHIPLPEPIKLPKPKKYFTPASKEQLAQMEAAAAKRRRRSPSSGGSVGRHSRSPSNDHARTRSTSNEPRSVTRDLSPDSSTTSTAPAPVSPSKLLDLLDQVPAGTSEPFWQFGKDKHGSSSTSFVRRASITNTVLDVTFLQAVSKPLSPAEAEASLKELHERRMAGIKAAQLQQAEAARSSDPSASPPSANGTTSPAVANSALGNNNLLDDSGPKAQMDQLEQPSSAQSVVILPVLASETTKLDAAVNSQLFQRRISTKLEEAKEQSPQPSRAADFSDDSASLLPAPSALPPVSHHGRRSSLMMGVGDMGDVVNTNSLVHHAVNHMRWGSESNLFKNKHEHRPSVSNSTIETDPNQPPPPTTTNDHHRHTSSQHSTIAQHSAKLRKLAPLAPPPIAAHQDVYVRPKTNPFLNAPMQR